MIITQHRVSVAPMMDCTDRHFRYLARLISRRTILYTEMVTTGAVIHGDREKLLGFDSSEAPLALQLGGSDPAELAKSARIGEDWGYQEINLNVGCPSDRVQAGRFGACLMKTPALVADCVTAMKAVVSIPVTVKCRIGVDDQDSQESLIAFTEGVTQAGCDLLIVHARKAWLSGLSPKENRSIPPLCYERVYDLKKQFPALPVIINGGVKTLDEVDQHLQHVDGVMIGREAYANPWLLADVDSRYFGESNSFSDPRDLIQAYLPYVQMALARGVRLRSLVRHLVGFFPGETGARQWRRYLSDHGGDELRGVDVIRGALAALF